MLPVKTSPEDVESLVSYLKTKATGATVKEAKAAIEPRLLDGRKLSAYRQWGFLDDDTERLKLTERGRRYSRASGGQKPQFFIQVINDIQAYRVATEWMFHNGFQMVTSDDLAAHWHEHLSDELGSDVERTIRDQVACFFQLAQAAGLGNYILGRGGSPSRFDINREALGQFIAEVAFEHPIESEADITAPTNHPAEALDDEATEPAEEPHRASTFQKTNPSPQEDVRLPARSVSDSARVFISHGKNNDIVEQMKTMLDLADLEYEVAVDEETTAIPVPDKVLSAMRRCTAAVICVTADEETRHDDGSYRINENVLIEIGAAFVLYEKRVVLVWDKRLPIPSNLQGLYRCEFEGNELSWGAGMKLMKAVNQFKKQ